MKATSLLILFYFCCAGVTAGANSFELSANCPPSFEKLTSGVCQLRTLYDFYDSPEQHGGVQARLPELPARYTPEQMDLGRFLFFDPILSVNQDMSCASCHQLDKGLGDGRKTSLGAMTDEGRKSLPRATPTLWNVGFLRKFMWDGRADTLTEQALLPLLSVDEMGHSKEGVVRALQSSKSYPALFNRAFQDGITLNNIAIALGAFQTTLISLNSRYDRYAHGDEEALDQSEIRGYNAFRGFVGRCSQCHIPPLFTDSELAVVGAPAGMDGAVDDGAGALSDDPFMIGAFRVPTLRNAALTAPYFHNGVFNDLDEVVGFYNKTRGHRAPEGQPLKIHWHVHMTDGPKLSERNVSDIVAFLQTLTDEKLMPQVPLSVPSGLPVLTTIKGEQ